MMYVFAMRLSEEARSGLRRRLGVPAAALDPDASYARLPRADADGGSVASSSSHRRPGAASTSGSASTSSPPALARFYFALAFEKLVLALLLLDAGASILRYVVGRETAAADLSPGLAQTAGTAAGSLLGALAWAAWALSAAEAGVFVRDAVGAWRRGAGWAAAGEAAAGGVEWQDASAWLWRLRAVDALAVAAHGSVLLLARSQASRLWLPALRVPLRMSVAGLLLEGELDHRTRRAIDAVGRYKERVEAAVTQGAKYEHAWLREVEARETLARDVAALESSAAGSAELVATLQEALLVAADDMAALEARLPPAAPTLPTHGLKPVADGSTGPTGEWRHAESPTASVDGYRTPPDDLRAASSHAAASDVPFSTVSRAAALLRMPYQHHAGALASGSGAFAEAAYGTRGYSDGVDVSDAPPASDLGSAGEDEQSPVAWEDASPFDHEGPHSPAVAAQLLQGMPGSPAASCQVVPPDDATDGVPAAIEPAGVSAGEWVATRSHAEEVPAGAEMLPSDAGTCDAGAAAEPAAANAGRAPSQSDAGSTTADAV